MSDVKVSVIMPFHNGEAYLKETMEAVLSQTLQEIEIICVDDESTDATVVGLREYEEKDERVKVVTQPKSNAGAARNLGKTMATGKYLLFLDSDDLFEADLVEKMYSACEADEAELCVCNADQYDVEKQEFIEKPQYFRESLLPEEIPFSKETMGKNILYFTTSVPWNKMVKREFVEEKGLAFQEIARANDQYFAIMSLLLAKRITVVKDKLVHYKVKQKENLTTKYSETPLCSYEAMLAVKQALEERGLLELEAVRCAFDNKILNLFLYSLNIQTSLEGYETLYCKMKEEGFQTLGFCLRDEDYYFDRLEYQNLQYIMEYSPAEYLLTKNREYRNTIAGKNHLLKQKNALIAMLRSDLRKATGELNYIKGTRRYKVVAGMTRVARVILRKK